jgi:hypothetical protein
MAQAIGRAARSNVACETLVPGYRQVGAPIERTLARTGTGTASTAPGDLAGQLGV